MTIIVETNQKTFKRIETGELTLIVHKFTKPIECGDTLIFQEKNEQKYHTGNERPFLITQIETDGCKAGYSAIGFKEKEA